MFDVVLPTHESRRRLPPIISNITDSFVDINKIIILDSSTEEVSYPLPEGESIEAYHLPHMNLWEKLDFAGGLPNSEYTIVHPDDEFLNPFALSEVEKFIHESNTNKLSILSYNIFFEVARSGCIQFNHKKSKQYLSAKEELKKEFESRVNNILNPYYQMVWTIHESSLFEDMYTKELADLNYAAFPEMVICINSHVNGKVKSIDKPLFFRCNRRLSKDVKSPVKIYSEWRNGDQEARRDLEKINEELILDTSVTDESSFSIEEILLRDYKRRQSQRQSSGESPLYLKAYRKLQNLARSSPPITLNEYTFKPYDLVDREAPAEFHQQQKSYVHEYWSDFGRHLIDFSKITPRTIPPLSTTIRSEVGSVLHRT